MERKLFVKNQITYSLDKNDVDYIIRSLDLWKGDIEKIELPIVHFRVVCSTGTYIRSLANDFGKALGVGGYMSSLRRTRIGHFNVADALSMEAFENEIEELKSLEG